MINDRIAGILDRIRALEDELQEEVEKRREELSYEIEDRKVRFSEGMRRLHRQYRTGLFEFLAGARLAHIASAPVIYGLVVPLALLDLAVIVYQQICFRVYRIPLVRRSDHVVIDRQHLGYLNGIEKLNCVYCGYGNGVLAFAREVAARTEQYWCPIKHARRIPSPHSRFGHFLDYGDAEAWRRELEKLRHEYDDLKPAGSVKQP
ncbi:MAG TPA: hypothetical protein ENK05_03270 [Gammaproteobacteria bacterium]|nr:hypothetical protein [Gammaproteobacteria bacterium]